ncbi:MAG: hypothetical protein JSR60_16730 [Proteobacteria bacterium]|nr:hypothetical protein [Pseudomonadota bacterium]
MSILSAILGFPFDKTERERVYRNLVGDKDGAQALAYILTGVQHNTEKAGALLAAQGMFAVACVFALDHGWPAAPTLAATFLLLAGALLAMSILRSSASPFLGAGAELTRNAFNLLLMRMLRFNLALYMTFLSVVLLAAAAFAFVR